MNKLRKLFQIIPKTEKNNLIFLIFLVILVTILELSSITFIYPLVDALINNKEVFLIRKYLDMINFHFYEINYNFFIIFLFLSLVLIKNFFLYIFINTQFNFIYRCEKKISESLLKKYTNLNYSFFISTHSSKLIRNMTHEVHLFNDILISYIVLISEILIVACLITVLFVFNSFITIFLIINFLLIAILFNEFFKKRTKKLSESLQKFEAIRLQKLTDGLSSIKEILIYKLNNFFIENYGDAHNETLKSRKYSSKLRQYPRLIVETFAVLIICLSLTILFTSSLNVNEILPTLSLFILVLLRTIPSQNKLIYSFQVIKFGEKTINLIFENLNIPEEKIIGNTAKLPFKEYISLKNLSFKYNDNGQYILKDLNLKFEKNKSYLIYGPNGSGKSTLLSILAGLIKPTEGSISIDQKDLHNSKANLIAWQKNIGYVPQSIFISDSSLLSNIALGVPKKEIDYSKIIELSKSCQLDKFISEKDFFDEKFTLGEKGNKFSGGQLQRIAIARSLYREPELLLLDEAMTGIDKLSEKELMEIIKILSNKMTIIMISHNMNHLEIFDEGIKISK